VLVESKWNVMAHGDAREEKWRGNKRLEWVTSKRHVTAEHRLARAVQTLQADVYSSPASSRLNWHPCRFKWTRPFRRKKKSGFCACAITFQQLSTLSSPTSSCCCHWNHISAYQTTATKEWPSCEMSSSNSGGDERCFYCDGAWCRRRE
jgi:hypothetical protein